METLSARIEVVAQLLLDARSKPDYAVMSSTQSECLASLAGKATLSGADRVKLAGNAGVIPWATPADRSQVLDALSADFPERRRVKQQDFCAILNYLPAKLWSDLKGPADLMQKCRLLIDHCVAMGLMHPSEPTYATLTSLLMVSHSGAEGARNLQPGFLRDVLLHVKGTFKTRAKCAPALEPVLHLPHEVAEFNDKFPRLYARAFASGPPAPCAVHFIDVSVVRGCIQMRCRKGGGCGGWLQQHQQQQTQQQQQSQLMQGFLSQLAQFFPSAPASSSLRLGNGSALHLSPPPPRLGNGVVLDLSPPLPPASPLVALQRAATPETLQDGLPLPPASPPAATPETLEALAADEDGSPPRKKVKLSVDAAASALLLAMESKERKAKPEKKDKKAKPAKNDQKANKDQKAEAVNKGKQDKTASAAQGKRAVPEAKPPCWCNERSRSQILFRTGLSGPGQTKTLKYDDKSSQATAIKKAKALVRAELARRGA